MVGSICRIGSSLYSVELQILKEEVDLVKAISCFSNHSEPEQVDKTVHMTHNYHNTAKYHCQSETVVMSMVTKTLPLSST